ncbi:hypothetical protein LTR15_006547 [Elasticomyces elasticus]|nr:hypothetical protein LTR15_006547 [Elasticomyces elasticus]
MPDRREYGKLEPEQPDNDLAFLPSRTSSGQQQNNPVLRPLRLNKRYIVLGGVAFLLICLLFAGAAHPDVRRRILPASGQDGLESILGRKEQLEEGFTLVTPTYRRLERLPTFLDNYATGKIPSLKRVVLLWADLENAAPESFTSTLSKYAVPVIIGELTHNSLNERFRATKDMPTKGILSVDDDVLITPEDTEMGYQAWRDWGEGRKRMTGYIPRELKADGTYVVERLPSYSMVLTKAAFFHHDWMYAYWSDDLLVTEARNYVGEHNNCEDILMSFLHAYFAQRPPLFVDAPFKDLGSGGISFQPGHMEQRTACTRKFLDIFGKDVMLSTNVSVKAY